MSWILMLSRQNSRCAISSFFNHSRTTMMVCGDLKSRTLTDIYCSSGVLKTDSRHKFRSMYHVNPGESLHMLTSPLNKKFNGEVNMCRLTSPLNKKFICSVAWPENHHLLTAFKSTL